jgi:hypothetical protein
LPSFAICRRAATDDAARHRAAAARAIGFRVRDRENEVEESGESQQKAGANYRFVENIHAAAPQLAVRAFEFKHSGEYKTRRLSFATSGHPDAATLLMRATTYIDMFLRERL